MSIADKLTQIAENEQRVYDAGKKAQYDEFWDTYQQNGTRTNYNFAFCGMGWNNDTLIPKYDIIPKANAGANIFRECDFSGSLKEYLESIGITLDVKDCTQMQYAFYACYQLTELPFLDLSSSTNNNYAFQYCSKLKALSLAVSENSTFTISFDSCDALVNLEVTGNIGNSVNLRWSKSLTKASIISVIKALWDSASGKTLTLSSAAVNAIEWAGTVIDGVTYNTFDDVANIKPNWNISLI